MEQPIPMPRGELPLAMPIISPTTGGVLARELHVLLRIPDCSQRVEKHPAIETSARQWPFGWLGKAQGFLATWRRPRTVIAASLAMVLVLAAVALAAAARQRETNHAGGSTRDDSSEALPWTAATVSSGVVVESAQALLEAPPFSGAASSPPSRPVKSSAAKSHGALRQGPAGSTIQGRKATGPTAHLEQRIDRAPSQY